MLKLCAKGNKSNTTGRTDLLFLVRARKEDSKLKAVLKARN